MKLDKAAKKVAEGTGETHVYMDFPAGHWVRIRTNSVPERLNREIRRCRRTIGAFSDGHSALMPVCARVLPARTSSLDNPVLRETNLHPFMTEQTLNRPGFDL